MLRRPIETARLIVYFTSGAAFNFARSTSETFLTSLSRSSFKLATAFKQDVYCECHNTQAVIKTLIRQGLEQRHLARVNLSLEVPD